MLKLTLNSTKKLLFPLFFLLTISPLFAVPSANYHGLFIAIDNYENKDWETTSTSIKDANILKNVLKSKYGFSNFTTLYNESATRVNILSKIEEQINTLSENDNLIIYFSGLSTNIEANSYWIPVEAESKKRYELISTTEIKSIISKAKSKHILLVVDGVFNNDLMKSFSERPNNDSEAYYNQMDLLLSRQLLISGKESTEMVKSEEKSVFSNYLTEFLSKNTKPILDVTSLFEMIKNPIVANSSYTPEIGHLQNTGHEGGQFLFYLQEESEEKLCDSPVYFEEGEVVKFEEFGGVLHAKTNFKNVKYEWSYNSNIIDNETADLKVEKSGMYGVTIIMENGDCSNSAIAEVEIVYPNIVIDVIGGNNIEFTEKGKLKATISGYDKPMTYEWRKGNFLIGNTINIDVIEADKYTLIVRLPNGHEIGRKTVEVTVKQRIYTIEIGDNMERIAHKFYGNKEYAALIYAANPDIKEGDVLRVGSQIKVPSKDDLDLNEKTLSIATTNALAPLANENSLNGGMLTDIVKEVCQEMNQPIEIQHIENKKLRTTYHGFYDLGFPFTKNTTDEMLFEYSDPIYTSLIVLFAKEGSEIKNLEDKKKKFIVAVPEAFISDKLAAYNKERRVFLKAYSDIESCFEAVKNGEADLVAINQIVGLVTLKNATNISRANFKMLEEPLESKTLHVVISKEHPDAKMIIKEFNKALATLNEKGKVSEIKDKHIDIIQSGKRP